MNERWIEYIDQLVQELDLTGWEVNLEDQPADQNADAQIRCVEGRKVAMLQLSHDFDTFDIGRQRHTIVHELLHIHEEASSQVVYKLRDLLGSAVFDVVWANYCLQREYMVDGLASIIAPSVSEVPKELWA